VLRSCVPDLRCWRALMNYIKLKLQPKHDCAEALQATVMGVM
jgi:hypothetical protein